jgi:hypothetical protein
MQIRLRLSRGSVVPFPPRPRSSFLSPKLRRSTGARGFRCNGHAMLSSAKTDRRLGDERSPASRCQQNTHAEGEVWGSGFIGPSSANTRCSSCASASSAFFASLCRSPSLTIAFGASTADGYFFLQRPCRNPLLPSSKEKDFPSLSESAPRQLCNNEYCKEKGGCRSRPPLSAACQGSALSTVDCLSRPRRGIEGRECFASRDRRGWRGAASPAHRSSDGHCPPHGWAHSRSG